MEKMMKDKIYPAIFANGVGCTILWFNENKGISLDDGGHVCKESTSKVKNITRDYLANTYGEVASPEHAEFIVELCESNGIDIFNHYDEGITNFVINSGEVIFTYVKPVIACHDKKITIPLPPKQTQTATPEEEFEMTQIEKNNGDNLILGCEDSKCDEWPCVGSKVQTSDGVGIVELLPDTKGYYVVSVDGEYYQYQIDELSKPKTPEEELRDELIEYLNELGISARYYFGGNELAADELLKSYNITKKPQ